MCIRAAENSLSVTHRLDASSDHDATVARVACAALFEHGHWVVAVAAKSLAAEAAGVYGKLRLHLCSVRFWVGTRELSIGLSLREELCNHAALVIMGTVCICGVGTSVNGATSFLALNISQELFFKLGQ